MKKATIEEIYIDRLIDFLIHLNDRGLINNHDFDYEKEAKIYAKKRNL